MIASFQRKTRPQAPNIKFSKNEKTSLGIHPRNKCAKFQPNWTIFDVSRLPQSFSLVLAKSSFPGPKMKIFEKWKKDLQGFIQWASVQIFSQIRPFLKFLGCPKVLASFWRKARPQAQKMKIFEKWKTHPQGFTQGESVQNFSQIRPFSGSSSTEVENFFLI